MIDRDRGEKLKSKVSYFGMMTALSLILSYVEMLIPIHFGVPGMKLGLANLIIVIVLYTHSLKAAFFISISRILLSGFLFGNMFAIIYSLSGGILSLLVMNFFKKKKSFSIIGVSISGGVSHNLGQLFVAMLVVESYKVGFYFPMLMVAGMLTGALIGVVSVEILKRLRKMPIIE